MWSMAASRQDICRLTRKLSTQTDRNSSQTDVYRHKKTYTVRGSKFANNAVAALDMVQYFYASANNRRGRHFLLSLSVRPSVNSYFARHDIFVPGGEISMKLATIIHHVSGY